MPYVTLGKRLSSIRDSLNFHLHAHSAYRQYSPRRRIVVAIVASGAIPLLLIVRARPSVYVDYHFGQYWRIPMILRLQSAISLFTCWCFLVTTVSATPADIGIVLASGNVQLDGVSVPGNTAVFSGSRIASVDGISNVRFSDGTSAVMRPGSQMTVYREHSVVLQGVTLQRGADKHPVIANGLKISGTVPNASVLVEVKDDSHFQVAAEGGDLEVRTSAGNLVARVEPGKNLSFSFSQAPAGTPQNAVEICGRLDANDLLKDEFTSVIDQLKGTDLESYRGKTVQVTGTVIDPSVTPQSVNVSTIRIVRSCLPAGAAAPAATVASGKGLIVVGLAMAGLGAGVYFAVSSNGQVPASPSAP